MVQSRYIEEVFISFYTLITRAGVGIQHQDSNACDSFYQVILNGENFTQNQANFLLRILDKYKIVMLKHGLDYQEDLKTPIWKKSFRVLDTAKRIWVEKSENDKIYICLKFPFALKTAFDEEFKNLKGSIWDAERKIRKMPVYDSNIVQLQEFAKTHGFEVDESFLEITGEIEEIWQNAEDVVPRSAIINNEVVLINSSEWVDEWWQQQATKNVAHDLFLAKSMGYNLQKKPENLVEKIASSETNTFWVKTTKELFSLYHTVQGKICIILDRTGDTLGWLKNFVNDADNFGINRGEIKVCFRANKDDQTGLNQWIKDAGVGGTVDDGKILIFEYKPAKWLFKETQNVKILVTKNLYPSTNTLTKEWMSSHPCVVYLGDIKPSEARKQKIVEL